MNTEKVTTENGNLPIYGVSESLTSYIQWITGLLTAKYGITDVNNLEVATEIVKFCSDEHRYLKLVSSTDEKVLSEFKDAWQNMHK